jgi:hypothetical protein
MELWDPGVSVEAAKPKQQKEKKEKVITVLFLLDRG